jgi:SAM-dependent methyltransferase
VTGAPELLDGPLDDLATLQGNLRDLRRANGWLGGTALSIRAVDALVGDAPEATILDVGSGAVDIPLALLEAGRRRGQGRRVTAVDSRAEVIEGAQRAWPGLASAEGLTIEVADGRDLPFDDGAFDVTHASLLLHHLDPPEARVVLAELRRVARRGVVLNDLDRGRLTVTGAWLASHLFTRNRYTRHDATLSARRAYTLAEARDLVRGARLTPIAELRGPARHRWAIAAVPG